MAVTSSEQALTALEKSKKDPILLLDDAANIARLRYDEHLFTFLTAELESSPDFRLQWLLKWLIKKINDAAHPKQESASRKAATPSSGGNIDVGKPSNLLTSPKTWALLAFLLESISHRACQAILLEREFTRLLTSGGNIIQGGFRHGDVSRDINHSSSASDDGADRQRPKRRKLSPELAQQSPNSSLAQNLMANYLRVAHSYARIISQSQVLTRDKASTTLRHAMPAWAQDIDQASKLLRGVLEIAADQSLWQWEDQEPYVTSTIIEWLDIWHETVSAVKLDDKQTVHQHFCEHGLNLCLQLLHRAPKSSGGTLKNKLRQTIEKYVAIYVILPVRTKFNESFATTWKNVDLVEWQSIKPLYEHLVKCLGSSLHAELVLGVEYVSFEKLHFASDLFEIGTRIIPRYDLRRCQWERPWLDAFYLALLHLAFPQHLYRLEAGKNMLLAPENEDLPFDSQQPAVWPTMMLETLLQQHTNASTSTVIYLSNAVLRWRLDHMPVSVLAQLVNIRVGTFIPQVTDANPKLCLDLLLGRLDGVEDLSEIEFRSLVNQVISPLVREFALARTLPELLSIWLPRLQDAFRTRSSVPLHYTNPTLLWDDEEIFGQFEESIKAYATAQFAQEQTQLLMSKLGGINNRIGPTTDIFAILAVCNTIFRAERSTTAFNLASQDLVSLSKSIIAALHQQTDYQGQKWRLWQALGTLLDLVYPNQDLAELEDIFGASIALNRLQVGSSTQEYASATLMECLQIFAVIVRYGSSKAVGAASDHLTNMMTACLSESIAKTSEVMHWLHASWDGRLTDLRTLPQLICGYVGCLLQEDPLRIPMFRDQLQPILKHSLIQASKSSVIGEQSAQYLVKQIEILFSAFCWSDDRSIFSQYMEFVSDRGRMIPISIIHSLPYDDLKKGAAKLHAESIVQQLSKVVDLEASMSAEENSELFALLFRLVNQYAVSVGLLENFLKLVQVARVLNMNHGTTIQTAEAHLNVTRYCVTRILHLAWDRLKQTSNSDKAKRVRKELFKWCKNTIKQFEERIAQQSELLIMDVVLSLLPGVDASLIDTSDVKRYKEKYLDALAGLPGSMLPFTWSLAKMSGTLAESRQEFLKKRDTTHTQRSSMFEKLASPSANGSLLASARLPRNNEDAVLNISKMRNHIRTMQSEILHQPTWQLLKNSMPNSDDVAMRTETAFRIGIFVHSLETKDLIQEPKLLSYLSSLASLQHMHRQPCPEDLVLCLELSKLVLATRPEVIGQPTIDRLLQSLCFIASNGIVVKIDSADPVRADAIYDRLLGTIETLLTKYRRRLNGRSHLLVHLLQALLRCLFYTPDQTYIYQNPTNTKHKQAFKSSLPVWLRNGQGLPLPPSSAERMSRIVSSICNPSIASARSAHRRKRTGASAVELNDETQKAKRIASQYMQYLLMEYSRCTLDGVIALETRNKLIPGLYSILDALGKDIMRAMNAAMDPSSRAIFRGLHDDWMRYGKWDQT